MLKVHITKINKKILIPEDEFEELLKEAKKSNDISVETDDFRDLIEASVSGLDFWNNETDDKVWNNA
jgi:hypothetical protein